MKSKKGLLIVLVSLCLGSGIGYFAHYLIQHGRNIEAHQDLITKVAWKMQHFKNDIHELHEHNPEAVDVALKENWPTIEKNLSELYNKHKQSSFAFEFLFFKSRVIFESENNLNLAVTLFEDAWNKLVTDDYVLTQQKAI